MYTDIKASLEAAWKLEDQNDLESAYLIYRKSFDQAKHEFALWRSYYFFLWYCLVEEGMLGIEKFNLDYNLREEYDSLLMYGRLTYPGIPEFNFIVGYTFSVYPYLFPDILENEAYGKQLIQKAWNLERNNLIYNMVRLSDTLPNSRDYAKSCINAFSLVLSQYKGNGYLNTYFRRVLCRIPHSNF